MKSKSVHSIIQNFLFVIIYTQSYLVNFFCLNLMFLASDDIHFSHLLFSNI